MSREREWQRSLQREDDDTHEDLWQVLAERICPLDSTRPGGPGRIANQDVPRLPDADLVLELRRAIFRSALERNGYYAVCLSRRIDRIAAELHQRGKDRDGYAASGAGDKAEPAAAGPSASGPALDRVAALEREVERVQHEAWLLWKQLQALRALPVNRPGASGWHELPRDDAVVIPRATAAPWERAATPDEKIERV